MVIFTAQDADGPATVIEEATAAVRHKRRIRDARREEKAAAPAAAWPRCPGWLSIGDPPLEDAAVIPSRCV